MIPELRLEGGREGKKRDDGRGMGRAKGEEQQRGTMGN